MAIARDSYAVSTAASGTSNTLSFNNVAGNVVLAFVPHANGGADTHNGAIWNGASMTFVGHAITGGTQDSGMDVYIITNADTGTHNLTANLTASKFMQVWGISYSGASNTQPDAFDIATGNDSTALSSNITVVASNCWVVAGAVNRSSLASAAGSGVLTIIANDGSEASAIFDSNGTVSTGSQAYGFTGATSNQNALLGVSIAPPSAAGPTNLKTYNTNVKANIKTMNTNPLANVKTFDDNA